MYGVTQFPFSSLSIVSSLSAVSNGIMTLHGGTLSVHSEGEGHGCTFTMSIPCEIHNDLVTYFDPMGVVSGTEPFESSPMHVPGLQCSLNTNEYSTAINAVHDSFTVLVVDDSDMSRRMICRLLSSRGVVCVEAVDGQDAVEKVRAAMARRTYDMVLMDYEMPILNGPKAAERMRALGYDRLVVGLTGHVGAAEADIFLSHGANKVLTKPLDVRAVAVLLGVSE